MEIVNINEHAVLSGLDKFFPTTLVVPAKKEVEIPSYSTAYGIAIEEGSLKINHKYFSIHKGMFFCVPGNAIIQNLIGLICIRENHKGIFTMGGPPETLGRLKYIDGCSDTLLLAPVICNDPCLNYLYVPPFIDQTTHTHPSVRIGCILEGKGYCLAGDKKIPLTPGNIFVLYSGEEHSFHTEDDFLRIFVFHPDSDFGPTHEIHPMINKTFRNGVSLRGDNKYRTVAIVE